MSRSQIIETMARAIRTSTYAHGFVADDLAQAALKALIEGGWVVVPREPTLEMCHAGRDAFIERTSLAAIAAYRAMVSTFLEGDQEGFMSSRIGGETCAASVASDQTGHDPFAGQLQEAQNDPEWVAKWGAPTSTGPQPNTKISDDPDVCFIEAALSTYDGGPASDDVRRAWARLKAVIHGATMARSQLKPTDPQGEGT